MDIEQLKLIIGAVNGMTDAALYVALAWVFLQVLYYGAWVIGVAIICKATVAVFTPKPKQFLLDDVAINEGVAANLKGTIQLVSTSRYIHQHHVEWLREAIEEKKAKK